MIYVGCKLTSVATGSGVDIFCLSVVVSKYFNLHKNLDYRFQARWCDPHLRSLRKILDVLFFIVQLMHTNYIKFINY
jgi:hypothetical protein